MISDTCHFYGISVPNFFFQLIFFVGRNKPHVRPYTWKNVFRHTWKVIFLINIVDDDVARFVWEMTERKWLYRYHYMRRYLMLCDRFADVEYAGLFVLYYRESFPQWDICLGIFITLRLMSFALYSNTKLFKCYAFRTVLSTIISGVFCSVALVPGIFAWHNDALVIFPIIECSLRCVAYTTVFLKVYRKLWSLDSDIVDFAVEPHDDYDCWVYRYYGNRRFLMFWDRLCEIFTVLLVIFYHFKSIAHWPVCVNYWHYLAHDFLCPVLQHQTMEMLPNPHCSSYNSICAMFNSTLGAVYFSFS